MNKNLSVKYLRVLRVALALSILAAVLLSTVFKGSLGTLCAYCPIGLAQVSLAGGSVVPLFVYSLIGFIVLAALFGRGFCAWGCSINVLPGRFSRREHKDKHTSDAACASGLTSAPLTDEDTADAGMLDTDAEQRAATVLPHRDDPAIQQALKASSRRNVVRALVLIAAILLISLFVGFPVFCLFCPIGLVFGLLFAFIKLFTTYQATWDLLIIPLILFVELHFLRSWCRTFCPLGALMSVVGKASPFRLRYHTDAGKCQVDSGCRVCNGVCPEEISSFAIGKDHDEQCILCGECAKRCPSDAFESVSFRTPKK